MSSDPLQDLAAQGAHNPSAEIEAAAGSALVGFFTDSDNALQNEGLIPNHPRNAARWYAALTQVIRNETTRVRDGGNDPETLQLYEQIWREIRTIELEVDQHGLTAAEVYRNRGQFFAGNPRPHMRIIFWDIRRNNVGTGPAGAGRQVVTADDQVDASGNGGQGRRLSDLARASRAGYHVDEEAQDGEDNARDEDGNNDDKAYEDGVDKDDDPRDQIYREDNVQAKNNDPASQSRTPATEQGGKRARTLPDHSLDSANHTSPTAQEKRKRARTGQSESERQSTDRRNQPEGEPKERLSRQDISKLSKGKLKRPPEKPLGHDWYFECGINGCTQLVKHKGDFQSHVNWNHEKDFTGGTMRPVVKDGKVQTDKNGVKKMHGFLIIKVIKKDDTTGEWTGTVDYPTATPVQGRMLRGTPKAIAARRAKEAGTSPGDNKDQSQDDDESQEHENPDDEQEGPSTPQHQVFTRAPSSAGTSVQGRLRQTTLSFSSGFSPRGSGAAGSVTHARAPQDEGETTDGADDPLEGPSNADTEDSA